MKRFKNWLLLVFGVLLLGLIVGMALVVMLGPTNGPVFLTRITPQVGIAVNKDLVVVDVIPGSPAEQAGIQRGDVVKKIGKQAVSSSMDTKRIVQQEIASVISESVNYGPETLKVSPLALVLSRGDGQLTLSLTPATPPFSSNSATKATGLMPTPTPAPSDFTYL